MREQLNFQGNGYGSKLVDKIYEGYSSKTFISPYDLAVIRSKVWDYPINVSFTQSSQGLFATLYTSAVSLSFTTQLVPENRPNSTLRFEGKLPPHAFLFADQVERNTFLPSIALITEDGFYIEND